MKAYQIAGGALKEMEIDSELDLFLQGFKQVHMGSYETVLRPRGSMKKESIGAMLLETLLAEHERWTDPCYSDNPDPEELVATLEQNLLDEVQAALAAFRARV